MAHECQEEADASVEWLDEIDMTVAQNLYTGLSSNFKNESISHMMASSQDSAKRIKVNLNLYTTERCEGCPISGFLETSSDGDLILLRCHTRGR
jgi:gentisate 1,2-dioxygenase